MKLKHWAVGIGCAALLAGCSQPVEGPTIEVDAGALPLVRTVDEHFQSYNVEMVELIGGRFWRPYSSLEAAGDAPMSDVTDGAVGLSEDLFEQREPIDLNNRRLRTLAAALGPAYIRVSGSWANTVYFQNNDDAPLTAPPEGYAGVLTRQQWRDLFDFARTVDGEVFTSFAINQAVRDRRGVWTPVQAQQLMDYTNEIGGEIFAAQLFNEPNLSQHGGGPREYSGADFARDIAAFRAFTATAAPDMLIVGPGDSPGVPAAADFVSSEPRPDFDVFNYHFYPGVSQRCAPPTNEQVGTRREEALEESYLGRTDAAFAAHEPLRDEYTPDAQIWITETGGAACGGAPWHATFVDTFRYVDQMGRLAKQGVDVIFHNTLAASDYALLDDHTFAPRPSYWAALLWRRLMDERVLDAGEVNPDLRVYAHCLRDQPGGVSLVAINTSDEASAVSIPTGGELFLLDAPELESKEARLNGSALTLGADDSLPELSGRRVGAGNVTISPHSIGFIAIAGANNPACS